MKEERIQKIILMKMIIIKKNKCIIIDLMYYSFVVLILQ